MHCLQKNSRKSYSWKCLYNMKHDSNPLHMFLEKVLNVLKIKYPTLQKCVYLTDRIYGISLWLLMGKALVMVLEVLSNALLVVQASGSLQEPINTLLKVFEWCRYQCHWIYICLSWWNREPDCRLWFKRKVPHLVESAWNKKFPLV